MLFWILALIGAQSLWLSYRLGRHLRVLIDSIFAARRYSCQDPPDLPRKDPFFGLDIMLESYTNIQNHTYLELCQRRFLKNGTTFKTKSMGVSSICTIDPENVKTVLSLKFNDFRLGDERKNAFVPLLGHGIFTSDGDDWKYSRRLLHPSFTRRHVGALEIYEGHTQNLMGHIPRDSSSSVDLQRLFFDLTIDTATETFCGQSSLCLAPEKQLPMNTKFASAFDRSQRTIANGVALGPLAAFTHIWGFKKDRRNVHNFIDHFVQKALERHNNNTSSISQGSDDDQTHHETFIDRLIQQVQDPIRLRGEILNVILAGRDTTASLLSNLWFVLARRPDVWRKLREEIDFLEGQAPTLEQLKALKYLRYCINECKCDRASRKITDF